MNDIIKTVGELIKELQKYPSNMKIVGYDGSDRERNVSLVENEDPDDENETTLMVCTD